MRPNDIDLHGVSASGDGSHWIGRSPKPDITIEDWDAIVSLALETLARDCDEMIAALETRMKSPLSRLFD